MTDERLRLVLADDHHLMVESLRSALSADYDIVAIALTASEALTAVRTHHPDILLLDLSLPERNGIELIPEVQRRSPRTRIIIVTMHLDRVLADTAIRNGAAGFVPKDAGLEELHRAIAAVREGATFVSTRIPPVTNRMATRASHPFLARLTPRQHEILALIAEECTSAEIARRLGLSERTIAFHRANMRHRLGVDSERGLMRYALMLRLDDPEAAAKAADSLVDDERPRAQE